MTINSPSPLLPRKGKNRKEGKSRGSLYYISVGGKEKKRNNSLIHSLSSCHWGGGEKSIRKKEGIGRTFVAAAYRKEQNKKGKLSSAVNRGEGGKTCPLPKRRRKD